MTRTDNHRNVILGGTMQPARAATLAGLVLAAFALPVTAYALDGTDDTGTPAAPLAHSKKPKPTESAKTAAPDDDATEDGDDSSAAGRAHAEAMKAWARCVAEAASGPKAAGSPRPPKLACGEKPMGPGRAKHLAGSGAPEATPSAPGNSGNHEPHGHGSPHAHGH